MLDFSHLCDISSTDVTPQPNIIYRTAAFVMCQEGRQGGEMGHKNTALSRAVPASVAQLDVPSDCRPGGHGLNPRRGRQHSFKETDHEIFSTFIFSLLLIQEGQLSVSGERMCTILLKCLEAGFKLAQKFREK